MAHGKPDWGLVGPKYTTYGLDDLGEAVVRLDSPVAWDRRGDVIKMVDFECGLGDGLIQTSGAGGTYHRSTGHTWHGAYSLELVAGSDLARSAQFLVFMPRPSQGGLGYELWVTSHNDVEYQIMTYDYFYQNNRYSAGIRFINATNEFQYYDAAGAYVTFVTLPVYININYVFHIWKLVYNVSDGVYNRFILDGFSYPLTNIPVNIVTPLVGERVATQFQVTANGGTNPNCFLDNLIFTQNEPA